MAVSPKHMDFNSLVRRFICLTKCLMWNWIFFDVIGDDDYRGYHPGKRFGWKQKRPPGDARKNAKGGIRTSR